MAGHNRFNVSGTAALPVGSGGDEIAASIVFEISSASSLSFTPQLCLGGSGNTPADCAAYNVRTGATVPAGTAITADGVYAVYVPGCQLYLKPTAGTAVVDWAVVFGKVG